MTIASTLPAESARRPAATRRRCCAACRPGRPRGRSGGVRIAPQQPAPSATRVWMPAASSTRAVALLMLGIIAGCTQPISISTLRGCSRVRPQVRARRRRRPAPCSSARPAAAAAPAGRASSPGANSGEVRPSLSSQRTARSPAGRSTRCVDDAAADVDQVAVLHAARAGGLAVAAGQAAVQVQLRRCASTGAPSSTCFIR